MSALRAIVIFLAIFAFATVGYNAAVNLPKAKEARSETYQIPSPPPPRAPDFSLSDAEKRAQWDQDARIAAEYNKKRDAVNERYDKIRNKRDMYSASATGIGVLAFLLSIAATWKKPKGLLVLGAMTAVLSGIAWVAITIASDGHL